MAAQASSAPGYRFLLTYQLAMVIYDLTVKFCERYLSEPKFRRLVEQKGKVETLVFRALVTFLLLVTAFHPSVFASDNLLFNADFEELDSLTSTPSGWGKYTVNTLTVESTSSSSLVSSGTRSALLKAANKSTKYIFQTVPVSGENTYKLSGQALLLSGNARVYLKLSWLDESSKEIGSQLSEETSQVGASFTRFSIEKLLPAATAYVTAKAVVYPQDSNLALAVFDNLLLEKVASSPPPPPVTKNDPQTTTPQGSVTEENTAQETASGPGKDKAIVPVQNQVDDNTFSFADILGTSSATPTAQQSTAKTPENKMSNQNSIPPIAVLLVILGAGLSSAALLSVKFKIWEKWVKGV